MQSALSTLFLLSAIACANAATFEQVGSTLVGSTDSAFGQGLSLSANGLVLAVGAPRFGSGSDADAGQVRLYSYNGTDWMAGVSLVGAAEELISDRLSLSAGGDHLAFRRSRSSAPDVAVVVDTAAGTQVGGELSCAFNGIEVSLALTGTRVAVSCETFSTTGRVEVFDLVGDAWVSIGTIDGDGAGSLFGWVTAFDSTGNRLAIGSPNQDSDALANNGLVRVYDYDGTTWTQVGGDLTGDDANEQFGYTLDMSSDGTTLAIGSPQSDGTGTSRGKVSTYGLVSGIAWDLVGSPVSGEDDEDRFGRSVSISSDGSVIAASSYLHNFSRGHARAFGFDGTDWVQLGEIEGASDFDSVGLGTKSVALDGSGSRLALGILGLDNELGESSGGVEVFDIVPSVSTASPSLTSIAPTPVPTSAVLSAGGTVPPTVTLSKFDWDLERVGNVTAAFSSATDTEELILRYSMNLRDFSVHILEEDCLTSVPQSVIDFDAGLSIANQTHGDLTIIMDVMRDAVVGSGVWTDTATGFGYLSLCVRVDLLNSDAAQTSVNFHEQKVEALAVCKPLITTAIAHPSRIQFTTQLFITIDLTQDFHVENIDLVRIAPSEESEAVKIDYDIDACQCDQTYTCTDEVHVQGSDLYICVFSNEPNVDIVSVPTVHLKHENATYIIIENTVEDSLTEVTTNLIGGSLAVIRTQLISELFDYASPGNLTAWGDVVLSFVANRRLGEPAQRRSVANGETEMAGFNIEIALVSSTDEHVEGGGEAGSGGVTLAVHGVLLAIAAATATAEALM